LTPFEKFIQKKNATSPSTPVPNPKVEDTDGNTDEQKQTGMETTSVMRKDPGIASPSANGQSQQNNDDKNIEADPNIKGETEHTAPASEIGGQSTGKPSNEPPMSDLNSSQEIPPGHGGLIRTPGSNDVLNGRGGRINSHRGNVQFRQLVNRYKHTYLASKKLDKVKIANKIVQYVRSMNPPGRFLMEDPASGDWIEIGDDKARKKAGQAMREKSDETRKEMKQRRASGAFLAQHHPPPTNTQNLSTLASVALFDFASSHNANASGRSHP